MENFNYYKSELSKLISDPSDYNMCIQIVDRKNNKTNYMDLNNESIEIIIEFLKTLKTK